MPVGARIWAARYDGSGAWPTAYHYLELFITQNGGIEPPSPNGYLAGFSVGYLAFFYWGHEQRYGPIRDVRGSPTTWYRSGRRPARCHGAAGPARRRRSPLRDEPLSYRSVELRSGWPYPVEVGHRQRVVPGGCREISV